jgi:hypothetical protein
VKYAWILAQSANDGVRLLCSMMRVSRRAYYAWAAASESKKATHDKELTAVITTIFTQNRAVYGTRRLIESWKNKAKP